MEKKLNEAGWLYLFGAWLTQRSEPSGPFGALHDSAPMAELVNEFCQMRGLGEPNFEEVNKEARKEYLKEPEAKFKIVPIMTEEECYKKENNDKEDSK